MAETSPLPTSNLFTAQRGAEFARYAGVSGSALAADFCIYDILLRTLTINPIWAGVTGFVVGVAVHFMLGLKFVFNRGASGKTMPRLFTEYAIAGLIGFMATAIIIHLAANVAGIDPRLAKVLAAGTSFLLVYLALSTLVFASKSAGEPAALKAS